MIHRRAIKEDAKAIERAQIGLQPDIHWLSHDSHAISNFIYNVWLPLKLGFQIILFNL